MGEAEGLHGVGEVSLEREDHDESQLDLRDRGRKPNMFSRRFEALDVSWLVKGFRESFRYTARSLRMWRKLDPFFFFCYKQNHRPHGQAVREKPVQCIQIVYYTSSKWNSFMQRPAAHVTHLHVDPSKRQSFPSTCIPLTVCKGINIHPHLPPPLLPRKRKHTTPPFPKPKATTTIK